MFTTSIVTRLEDGYDEGILLTIHQRYPDDYIACQVSARTAIAIGESLIEKATEVLSQSAANCGCDAKADYWCERHRGEAFDQPALNFKES